MASEVGFKPISLIVGEPGSIDNSVVIINQVKLEELSVSPCSTVLLTGRIKRKTVCLVYGIGSCPTDQILMSSIVRDNLGVSLGDNVIVRSCQQGVYGNSVTVTPIYYKKDEVKKKLFETYLKPYFDEIPRPIHIGDILNITRNLESVRFKVIETDPSPFCIVAGHTILHHSGEPLKGEEEDNCFDEVGYDSIGGYGAQLMEIKKRIEHSLRLPDIYRQLGGRNRACTGMLIYGLSGTGKTLLSQAISNETELFFCHVNGRELMGQLTDSVSNLTSMFEEARKNAPSIIFMDELDAIAPNMDKINGEIERQVLNQLITLVDGVHKVPQIVLMAATNRINSIDPSLRCPGRFGQEIELGIPTAAGRLEILRIQTRKINLNADVDLTKIADESHGRVGSDLELLCTEAMLHRSDEEWSRMGLQTDTPISVYMHNFDYALGKIGPGVLKEIEMSIPPTTWVDIGGLESVRETLHELIEYPLLYQDKMLTYDMRAPKGVLLYGPPGCGKTLLAKAVANKCQSNFISVKASDLLTMWFGQSESNVAALFTKARAASPCVLFFDELDGIATSRSGNTGDGDRAADRVTNQLLMEMDGMSVNTNVFIIGATNRPEIVDPALIRPGRIDKKIYVPLPDLRSRESIFKTILLETSKAADVDLAYLATMTHGFSGADIDEVCQTARMSALRRDVGEEKLHINPESVTHVRPDRCITKCQFDEAVRIVRPSVSAIDIQRYENFDKSHIETSTSMQQVPLAPTDAMDIGLAPVVFPPNSLPDFYSCFSRASNGP